VNSAAGRQDGRATASIRRARTTLDPVTQLGVSQTHGANEALPETSTSTSQIPPSAKQAAGIYLSFCVVEVSSHHVQYLSSRSYTHPFHFNLFSDFLEFSYPYLTRTQKGLDKTEPEKEEGS